MPGCPLASRLRGTGSVVNGNFLNFWHLELEWTHLADDNEIGISYFLEASYTVKTRSHAIARIADRIASHIRLSSY